MRRLILLPLAALAGCGEPVADNHFANEAATETPPPAATVSIDAVPVRIGELGPSFAACNAAGTTRNLGEGETLPVSAAPFDNAAKTGAIAAGSRFFVCTRSHDQRWMGVVHDESGELSPECGVSAPVTARRAYDGPCRSGWISSAFVRLVAR